MLKGRLGLATARIPQGDRHGLLWLRRGQLYAASGTLRFTAAGDGEGGEMAPGDYGIPYQMLTAILLEPGTTVSHDAMRLLAGHGTGLFAVGEGGVRFYACSVPDGPSRSARARAQARLWANLEQRAALARRMYAWRLGEVLPNASIEVLRGIEGSRMKETYRLLASEYGIQWRRRKYDRDDPGAADLPNQAINHAATAVYALSEVAASVAGAIPQLGFIHEDSSRAFCLDIADLYRDDFTLPVAFASLVEHKKHPDNIERIVRRFTGREIRRRHLLPKMLDRIKEMFDGGGGDAKRS